MFIKVKEVEEVKEEEEGEEEEEEEEEEEKEKAAAAAVDDYWALRSFPGHTPSHTPAGRPQPPQVESSLQGCVSVLTDHSKMHKVLPCTGATCR